MCKIGDILLIYNAKNGQYVGKHPFIVLDDNAGKVRGVYSYDFIGLLVSSANTEEKKERLRSFEGNFPISPDDKVMDNVDKTNRMNSFVKADQFFYFDKSKIKYIKIGSLVPDIFNLIIEFIQELAEAGIVFQQILDKAKKINIQGT